jgi:hypothetical protein
VYLRTCIRYLHRNPVDAGICSHPAHYRWSSHNRYAVAGSSADPRPRLLMARELFATVPRPDVEKLCADYRAFVESDEPPNLDFSEGDRFWRDFCRPRAVLVSPTHRPDLRDIALAELEKHDCEMDVLTLRTGRGAFVAEVRRRIVLRAARSGYSGCDIARYLHLSESRVSRIIRRLTNRWPAAQLPKHRKTRQKAR